MKLSKPVVIPPKSVVEVSGVTELKGHGMRHALLAESCSEEPTKWKVAPTYTELKPGSSRVKIQVGNESEEAIKLPAKKVVAIVSSAIVVPDQIKEDSVQAEAKPVEDEKIAERKKMVLEKINLDSIKEFDQEFQEKFTEMITGFQDIIALGDLEMGKTNLIKHHIEVNDPVPFKDRHSRIPPSSIEELRSLLNLMETSKVISKSNSPWSSPIVLVRKKDGSLRFCIDLRKLNARTIKDSYALPRIDETLDLLGGAKYFTALDLKSGYWQVELDEASKPLTAFTVGPLGFYQCEVMPFGATNAPATFQRLMQIALGDLNMRCCLIY